MMTQKFGEAAHEMLKATPVALPCAAGGGSVLAGTRQGGKHITCCTRQCGDDEGVVRE